MKPLSIPTFVSVFCILLVGCSDAAQSSITLEEELKNPLFAEQYGQIVVDYFVNLHLKKDPSIEDGGKSAVIEKSKDAWLANTKKARARQREGIKGQFTPLKDVTLGEVLFLEGTLYFSPLFSAEVSPFTTLYFSHIIDPRDAETFPDDTSVDLGLLQSPFGAQQYVVPENVNPEEPLRTVVLYDPVTERLHGFAQLK